MNRWVCGLASVGIGTGLVLATWTMAPAQSLPLVPTTVTVASLEVTVPTLPPLTVPTVPVVETTVPTVPPLPTEPTVPTVPGVTTPTVPVTVPSTVTVPTVPTSVTVPLVGTVTVPTLPNVTLPTLPQVPATVPGGVRPDGLVECAHFLTQQAAQVALQLDPRLAGLLDADRDGVACELLPSGPATVPAGSGAPGTVGSASAGGSGGAAASPGTVGAIDQTGGGAGDGSSAGTAPASGAAGSPASGAAGSRGPAGSVTVDGQPVASTAPLEVPEAEAGHLVLIVLAFVLLLGSTAGLARELSARRAARTEVEADGLDGLAVA